MLVFEVAPGWRQSEFNGGCKFPVALDLRCRTWLLRAQVYAWVILLVIDVGFGPPIKVHIFIGLTRNRQLEL